MDWQYNQYFVEDLLQQNTQIIKKPLMSPLILNHFILALFYGAHISKKFTQ